MFWVGLLLVTGRQTLITLLELWGVKICFKSESAFIVDNTAERKTELNETITRLLSLEWVDQHELTSLRGRLQFDAPTPFEKGIVPYSNNKSRKILFSDKRLFCFMLLRDYMSSYHMDLMLLDMFYICSSSACRIGEFFVCEPPLEVCRSLSSRPVALVIRGFSLFRRWRMESPSSSGRDFEAASSHLHSLQGRAPFC